ncbi:condensin complex subunit 2 isoform X2 [Diabrotica virgifera virgifera]|uniref:Condensin complex subunit 2 n=1 Tax=Diabrotica virgifera virgifera TaxID=50390 RepID=A0A6P7G2K3_DIAVI|nr:condensin complex subunit 2 isoform X2 [Diabrotica virgifera virgifera]
MKVSERGILYTPNISFRSTRPSNNSNLFKAKREILKFLEKITSKNAWKLQIIDMLKPLCQKSGKDVLQVATTSIDISAKVYGIRVDDVHSEGLKLANNMARVANTDEPDNDEGEQSGGEQDNAAAASKKKKRKRPNQTGVKSTINKNPKGNLGKLPKLEPTDFTTRVKPDAGTIDNLFTNMLKETSNCFIVLDKNKKYFEESDSIVKKEEKISMKNIKIPKTVGSINPSFNDFIVDVWDPDQEEKRLNENSMLSQIQPVVFDDRGFPIPELDGSIHDIFETNDMDVDVDDDDVIEVRQAESLLPQIRDSVHVVDYRPMEMSIQTSEYSFNPVVRTSNGKYIDQIWAGPSHWKLKFIRRSTPRFSGRANTTEKQPTKRGRKKPIVEKINYEAEPPEINFNNELVIKKKPPAVDMHKITLPLMDQSCARIMETMKELMLKPGVCPVEKSAVKKDENRDEIEVSPYKYENPNDSLYCSQNQDDNDNDADMDNDNIAGDDEHLVQFGGNLTDNLVENPEMVPSTYIQYAKQAKQINMKKLKSAIWYKLTNVTIETQDTNVKIIPQTYSELYKALPDIMPSKEKEKLSCPLAFFALLHLTNEKNLSLSRMPGKNDCYIEGPQ